jgi:nucleotide-binding universal stress UspA family protein
MIKTVLVPAPGDGTEIGCLTAALNIARAFAAHIDVLHVRIDPVQLAVSMMAEPGGGLLIEGVVAQLEQDAAQHEAATRQVFENFCAREKLQLFDAPPSDGSATASAQWHVVTGDDAGKIATFGRAADLIVAGRSVDRDSANRSRPEAALLETGRPLLIPGHAATSDIIGGTVAIGWKDTPQAARAVAGAMPLLARANEIVVMTVAEREEPEDSTDRLVRNLAWHGLRAGKRILRPAGQDAAETLLSAAAEQAALLVMGGYGHSRVREWIFGGFTQRVLEDAPLPVLLAH